MFLDTKIRGKSEKGSHVVFFVEASSIEDKVQSRSDKLKKIEENSRELKKTPTSSMQLSNTKLKINYIYLE